MKAVWGASSRLPKIPWELLVSFLVAMKTSRASKKPADDQAIKRAQTCAEKMIFH